MQIHMSTWSGIADELESEFDLEVDWLMTCAARLSTTKTTTTHPVIHLSQTVLIAIRSAIPSGHTAICLLNYQTWPDNSYLAGSPLPDIQRLVLLVKLNDTVKYTSYCSGLVGFMHADSKRPSSRRAALHIACSARQDLATVATASVDVQNNVFSVLSPALLTVVQANRFEAYHDFYYLSLIFALAKRPNWLPRLLEDDHIARCIRISLLIASFTSQESSSAFDFFIHSMDDGMDILEDLTKGTTTYMRMLPDASRSELEFLR